jgi:hypothetical protein
LKQVDLEPSEYGVKGGKEPILHRGWWKGILLFVVVVLMGMYVVPPVRGFFHGVIAPLFGK